MSKRVAETASQTVTMNGSQRAQAERVNNFLNGARKVTDADAALAIAYYPLLVGLAGRRQTTTFKAFVELAKETYPDNPAVQNAIPVSTGRRLEFVRVFTARNGLPDLSAWVTNRQGKNSAAYEGDFDPDEERRRSAEVDWSEHQSAWEAHAAELRRRAARVRRRSHDDALRMMADVAMKMRPRIQKAIPNPHDRPYAELVGPYRETILQDLMSGLDPEEVFENVLLDVGNAED